MDNQSNLSKAVKGPNAKIAESINERNVYLGIELGSTRIKAVLIDSQYAPVASGSFDWENKLENGIWTYGLEDVWHGLQSSFRQLSEEAYKLYGAKLTKISSIGISAMMHGYLVFDDNGSQLAPFRTWRNTITGQAASELTSRFNFNIPQRWSIAHLYQAILNNEAHISEISFLTTLAGYVHWKLTGQKVIGIGDASGIFPIDSETNNYDSHMVQEFDSILDGKNLKYKLEGILPRVLNAGEKAGELTREGALLLDPSGQLEPGIPLCPPEGDAGTGMVATNSVAKRTGNISAGTSIFAMVVLEKKLSRVYTEIDMVTTPTGKPVAMVHCNNCTSDLDAWVRIFNESAKLFGLDIEKSALYEALYNKALEGDPDCGGLTSYNYYSGEPITGLEEGRPLFARLPDSNFTLANFMRSLLFSAIGTLKLGMDILTEKENVRLDTLLGHGGLFKTKLVGQRLMSAALDAPIAVMESAGEGGAWGIALLAAFLNDRQENETLESFLLEKVFQHANGTRVEPNGEDKKGFISFMSRYTKALEVERTAVQYLK
ncbi:MAG: FGGY-family carbohydrate kinase [Clostridiales bacterium]|jgi:sugar (pentulose or hexulose) kinase|nr:FGGY-family carbohydrate kinase [Clostridiales bacterium]